MQTSEILEPEIKYFDNKYNLRDANTKYFKYEPWMLEEIKKCAKDIVYFCEKYLKIETAAGMTIWGETEHGIWDFQKEFLQLMAKDINILAKWPRQVGKSTTTRAYLLWYAMFHKGKRVAILANKEDLAKEQLELAKASYIELPYWLQMGVRTWNQREFVLGNGSRILARATSKDAIRGMTIHKLYCDEFAFVDDGIAEEFIRSVFPTVSSGKAGERNLIITSTPKGMNHFYRLWIKSENGKGTFKTIQIPWNAVPGRNEEWAKLRIEEIGEIAFNQEFRCEFLGSDATLINSEYLSHLMKESSKYEPLPIKVEKRLEGKIRVYQLPIPKHTMDIKGWTYIACMDTGMGMKDDSTVMQIFLAKNNRNLHQVAVMSTNDLNVREFCSASMGLLKAFGNPPLLIEAGNPGDSAITIFLNVLLYENLIHMDPKGRRLGVVPTSKSKGAAIVYTKAYIEKNLMKVVDDKTISELSSFGRVGEKKWKGKNGSHDDHVTSLIWIPYYVNSPNYWGTIAEDQLKNNVSLFEIPNDSRVVGNVMSEHEVKILLSTGKYGNFPSDDVEIEADDLIDEYQIG